MRNEGLTIGLGPQWLVLYRDFAVNRQGRFVDSLGKQKQDFTSFFRPIFQNGNYAEVLGAVEWIVRKTTSVSLHRKFEKALADERCAYRLIEKSMIPVASPEEGNAVKGAVEALSGPGLGGARGHLLKAGSALTIGNYADSVRESIHAVESVARSRTGKSSLSSALAELSEKHPLHPALSKGFNSIYGYTSDANGIRHPMVGEDAAQVGEAEAIFMLGACASFVTFLASISRD
ncbi:hypothetical protein D3C80_1403990 [compost metagenome]